MLAKYLLFPLIQRFLPFLDAHSQNVVMVLWDHLRHNSVNVLVHEIFLLAITKYLAEAHIALGDETQLLLFSRNVDTRSAIRWRIVDVREVLVSVVELKVDSQVVLVLRLLHQLVPLLLVIENFSDETRIEALSLRLTGRHLRKDFPVILHWRNGGVDLCALLGEAHQIWLLVRQMVPEFVVKHRWFLNQMFELLELVFEVYCRHNIHSTHFLAFWKFVLNEPSLSEDLELVVEPRFNLFSLLQFI